MDESVWLPAEVKAQRPNCGDQLAAVVVAIMIRCRLNKGARHNRQRFRRRYRSFLRQKKLRFQLPELISIRRCGNSCRSQDMATRDRIRPRRQMAQVMVAEWDANGTGIGEGLGPGFGPGEGGNTGGERKGPPGGGGQGGSDGNNTDDTNRIYSSPQVTERARVISKPEPQYTEDARRNQITGTVVLRAVFSCTGEVTNIRAVNALPFGLTEKAIAAARLIRFRPATKDGRPVNVHMQLEYNFNLY